MWFFGSFANALRQLDRSARARGAGYTAKLALKVLWNEGPTGVRNRLNALGPVLRADRARSPQSALILTTPHTQHFAQRLAEILTEVGFQAELSDNDRDAKSFGLIIAFAPQAFPDLPLDRTIAFQVEPHVIPDRWTPDYIDRLAKCRAVFDYSTENIERLREWLPLRHLYHVPFSPLPAATQITPRSSVLFYGAAHSLRRQEILAKLSRRVPELEVETNLFGPAIKERLQRAAIVVNIHTAEGVALETARISEALSAGAVVVSEAAPDQFDYPELFDRVSFVDEGDIDALSAKLRQLIDNPDELAARQSSATLPVPNRFRQGVLRALQGLGIIPPDQFEKLVQDYPSPTEGQPMALPRICLTLPEAPARTRAFRARNQGYRIWPGMKAFPGWRGCALSYRHIFRSLIRSGVNEALIVEDDVLLPADFDHRLSLARTYMDKQNADMFSGLIVDLNKDARILDVEEIDGITFVTLDRAVMTICNLYRSRMIEWLADWDDTDTNAFTNAIDRYMERATHLRVVTTLPFTAGYMDEAASTLRESGNDQFDAILARSNERLAAKVATFRSG